MTNVIVSTSRIRITEDRYRTETSDASVPYVWKHMFTMTS